MPRTGARLAVLLGAVVGLAALGAGTARAQQPGLAHRWELRGPQFDFSPDGVWRRKARGVAQARAAAIARGDFAALNAASQLAGPALSGMAVSGTLNVPAILLRFLDTPAGVRDSSEYTQTLFGSVPPNGRPYTVRTLYEEMSNGLFSLQGNAVGWVTLDSNESRYVGPATGCPSQFGPCNGIWSTAAFALLRAGLQQAVVKADALVSFGQYDNDGPDGVPNSGDDDGFVDLVIFVQPMKDGACASATNNHVWAHRSSLSGVATADPRTGGGVIRVSNYIIQSGVGGVGACDSTQMMPIGTAAHETGHGIGLKDLYDTNANDGDDSEGIGGWGLMGSGNYYTPFSPSSFEALSRSVLGWVTVRQLQTTGTFSFGPSALGDTVFLVRPTGSNPRGEYFLLENRQGVLTDSARIRSTGPGLQVWHVDSLQYYTRFNSNDINSGVTHGVVLVEAHGAPYHLLVSTGGNRGDGGDPFPGTSGVTTLVPDPANKGWLNSGVAPGFQLDSITQLEVKGPMRFRVAFGSNLTVAAADTTAKVRVRGQLAGRFRRFMPQGDTVTIAIDTVQTDVAGTTQYRFASWSDGGAHTHQVTVGSRDTTITAAVTRRYDVRWTVTGPGTVSATPAVAATGSWVADGDSVVLVAVPNPNAIFMGWTGDATTSERRIAPLAVQPYNVTATFSAASVDSVVRHLLVGTGLLTPQVEALDYLGNRNGRFDLGDFVAWLDQSGTAVSAELMARIFARVRQ
jgi:M6 family metalloprotease-like protein